MRAAAISIALLVASPVAADEWAPTDTGFQLTMVTLQIVDWGQTRSSLDKMCTNSYATWPCHIELNPLVGERPSKARLNLTVGGAIVGHALVAYLLPQPWRRIWQGIGISVEVASVAHNRINVGASWKSPF